MTMRKAGITLFISILVIFSIGAQQQTIQERLGYPKASKLLIIHADDLGVSHAENMGSIHALETGPVTSASIMVPCPWFGEIAAYAANHPEGDFGLHLTLTSEWKLYKWGPVLPRTQVPGLVDQKGYFYESVEDVGQHAKGPEVEQELRAQIERAIQFGIKPTHFDTHMGSVTANPEFIKTYIQLGRAYKVPVLLTADAVKSMASTPLKDFLTQKDVVIDKLIMATPADYQKGMEQFYTSVLKSLQPGLNCLLLHAAYDNEEMQAVTMDHPDYGSSWRQADLNFFTSAECKRVIAEQHIQLITWKEIKNKLLKD